MNAIRTETVDSALVEELFEPQPVSEATNLSPRPDRPDFVIWAFSAEPGARDEVVTPIAA
jgi:hypothetical protein